MKVGADPPENELAILFAKKKKPASEDESSKEQDVTSDDQTASNERNSGTSTTIPKKTLGGVTAKPAENELGSVWAKKANLNAAEQKETQRAGVFSAAREGARLGVKGNASLRVFPPCVRASQEEEANLTNSTDMEETFEPVGRVRAKSIKLGSTELVLDGNGGKGQALFLKMAQTNPE